jgi:hypothetical protein
LAATRARIESGTLRGWSQSARADECDQITGARLTRSASLIVPSLVCERSTEHPQPVHLAHHPLAERREPAVARGVERGVGPVERDVVRERHVAHARS